MFDKIDDVPVSISEFYTVEVRPVQQLSEDDTPIFTKEEYSYKDETGVSQKGWRIVPVFVSMDVVVQIPRRERKSLDDVWRIAARHRGKRDDLIRKFLAEACSNTQWTFHDEYLQWYERGLELESLVLEVNEESEVDLEQLHQRLIEAHEAKEPVKPHKIDIDKWFTDNARHLRLLGYAPANEQAEMHFNDTVNDTTTLVDHNLAVKSQYPKD